MSVERSEGPVGSSEGNWPGDDIAVAVEGATCVIEVNRPDVLNALRRQTRDELAQALVEFDSDPSLRVAILKGSGERAFSAGADLGEIASDPLAATGTPRARPTVPAPGRLRGFDELAALNKPIIAAIDGHCLGAGLELALLCDIRIATQQSSFGLPEARRSLLAGPGLIHLSRIIPLGEALRMQLTGSPIGAQRAFEVGLVSELCNDREQLLGAARSLAADIESCAPLAVEYIKRIVREGRDQTVDAQWRLSEMYWASVIRSEDAEEGPAAFVEKRPAVWTGR